jgi:hypothetical protein
MTSSAALPVLSPDQVLPLLRGRKHGASKLRDYAARNFS